MREYQVTFGGHVHDGFKPPDDGTVLPPYMRATYTLTAATWEDGQTPPTAFIRSHHRWSATSTGTYAAGDHARRDPLPGDRRIPADPARVGGPRPAAGRALLAPATR